MNFFKHDYSLFLGSESENTAIDFIAEDNFFAILQTEDQNLKSELKERSEVLKEHVTKSRLGSLSEFKAVVDECLTEGMNFAGAFFIDETAYFVTKGKGVVALRRSGSVFNLLSGNNIASGHLNDHDFFILTTESFRQKYKLEKFNEFSDETPVKSIVETVTPELKELGDAGFVSFFIHSNKVVVAPSEETEEQTFEVKEKLPEPVLSQRKKLFTAGALARFKESLRVQPTKNKKLTLIVIVILTGIFVWSVVLGNERRAKNAFIEHVKKQELVIDSKLNEAKEMSGFNIKKSLSLVEEANVLYGDLVVEAKTKKLENLEQLASVKAKISQMRQKVDKSETGKSEEFYDLDLIENSATSSDMYLEDDTLALLNSDEGKVYIMSVSKKSVDIVKSAKMKDARFVAVHHGAPYVFTDKDGIFLFNIEDNKGKQLVENDKDWGSIKDFWMYSGNIYLLDSEKDEVYKYLVAENGYSNKSSYFGSGQSINLENAQRFAIDGSVYITLDGAIARYDSGVREKFSLDLPEDSIQFDMIYTSKELDDIYAVDRETEGVFIISKEGKFKKQISTSLIGDADDIIVTAEKEILILAKNKLYKILD